MKNKKPKMTRQHFEAVANIISQFDKFNITTAQKRYITKCFISFFKTQNKNFDQKKFYNKCMINSLDILEVEDLFIKDMEPNNNLNPDTTEMEKLLNEVYNETMKGGN